MNDILKKQLKRLVMHDDFQHIYACQAKLVEQWNKGPLVGETEFQTIKNAIERESKIAGVQEFLDTMERLALDNHDK